MGKFSFDPPTIEIHRRIMPDVRLKFTITHELGHFFLHRNLKVKRGDYVLDSKEDIFGTTAPARHWMEWQANRFAAAFLAPSDTIAEATKNALLDVKRARIRGSRRKAKVVKLVSIAYDVNTSMIRYRLEELGVFPTG